MIELTRNGDTWQVRKDGAIVFAGSMPEARAEYSRADGRGA